MIAEIIKKILFGSSLKRKTISPYMYDLLKKEWANIDILLKQKGPSQLRQALISADKCLDNALKELVEGESLGERLKAGQDKFDTITYNKLWEAHKVRNSLVHETGYEPPHYVITDAVNKLKRGLQELGVKL